jgi:hypothetical protein
VVASGEMSDKRHPTSRPPKDIAKIDTAPHRGSAAIVVPAGVGVRSSKVSVDYAKNRAEILQSCDCDRPLSPVDQRWQDLTLGRGDHSVQTALRRLTNKPQDRQLHLVFASHRGAGKTTELARLASAVSSRYFPLYLDSSLEMDSNRIDAEDLLLVLARFVESWMRENKTPLPSDLLEKVSSWFKDVIQTTSWGKDLSVDLASGLKVEAGLPLFAKLTASITSLFKHESKHREEVKGVLKKYPGTLLDSVNFLLDAANEILSRSGKELLIVIDSLDRYQPEVIDGLLVGRADTIRALRCNLILTPPISLIYRPHSDALDQMFPCEVMNTVRLRRPDQPYTAFDGPGRDLLLEALANRIDLKALIPDSKAQDRLVTASGGAIRELLKLVTDASFSAVGNLISLADVEDAVKRRKQLLRDLINANGWWPVLARIAKDKQIFADEACLRVLYLRLVFKYNGEGWYDVHPLVAELPEFLHASQSQITSAG